VDAGSIGDRATLDHEIGCNAGVGISRAVASVLLKRDERLPAEVVQRTRTKLRRKTAVPALAGASGWYSVRRPRDQVESTLGA
jgi:hypothetical protein